MHMEIWLTSRFGAINVLEARLQNFLLFSPPYSCPLCTLSCAQVSLKVLFTKPELEVCPHIEEAAVRLSVLPIRLNIDQVPELHDYHALQHHLYNYSDHYHMVLRMYIHVFVHCRIHTLQNIHACTGIHVSTLSVCYTVGPVLIAII